MPEMELEWKVPAKSNAIERDRARSYHQAYSAAVALYNLEKALVEVRAGRTKSWSDFKVPQEAVSVGFHEAARGVLSHHMVIRDGKIANYQPYPPTPWNASPRDMYGTPGPYEDAVQNTPIFEENGPDKFKGVDIMRAVRSFDPCLPCGVHMYNGRGKVRKVMHTPTGLVAMERWSPKRSSSRVQRLTAELDTVRIRTPATVAEQLAAAIVDMYGEGIERMRRGPGRRRAARARGEPGRRQPAADPRPSPGAARAARAAGARPGAAVHEVARRGRRAARHRGRASCICGSKAAATAVARPPRRSSWRSRRRSRKQRPISPACRWRERRSEPEVTGMPLPMAAVDRPGQSLGLAGARRRRDLRGRRAASPSSSTARPSSSPTSRESCSPSTTAARRAARPLAGGELQRGCARLPRVRARVLPAARRPLSRRRAAAACARSRCCATVQAAKVALHA